MNTKFLGLQTDNHINWKNHTGQMIPKFSGACCATRSMVHISNINTLKSIYHAYFHSVIKYGIFLGGNSSNSGKIFSLQKKIIRNMAGAQPRSCCRSLFKQSEILPVPCHYILSLMNLIIIRKFFKEIYLYIILIQGISNIFIDQMPTYFVFKTIRSKLATIFQQFTT